jgi:ribosomal protein L12E/L44/L45/RPP1/RPP2
LRLSRAVAGLDIEEVEVVSVPSGGSAVEAMGGRPVTGSTTSTTKTEEEEDEDEEETEKEMMWGRRNRT